MARPHFATDPFALGVASGDPVADGFVIWTRLVGQDLRELADEAIDVKWEVSDDSGFRHIVRSGRQQALSGQGHSVHIEVGGLQPGRPYWYRFYAGDAVSDIGRSCTAPLTADRLTFALVSCQHWEQGWFSAYQDMLSANPDLIVHVGDYIYEKSFGSGPNVRSFGTRDPIDLGDYRQRHALYKTDHHLRAAHAAVPWLVTWDDHEVQNDYAGIHPGDSDDVAAFVQRRAAAYRAYVEHMPLRMSRLRKDAKVSLYRRSRWADLATFHILDARQYRDDQPCGTSDEFGGRRIEDCKEALDPRRSMLGFTQEAWLAAGLKNDRATWSFLTQQTLFSQLNLSGGKPAYWSDVWDGYAANRNRLLEAMGQCPARNKVVLGGDVHSFWAADVKANYDEPKSTTLATEFVGTCLASRNPPRSMFGPVFSPNPHIRFMDDEHSGYLLMNLDRKHLRVDMRAVGDLTNPHSACSSLRSFAVESGMAGAQSS